MEKEQLVSELLTYYLLVRESMKGKDLQESKDILEDCFLQNGVCYAISNLYKRDGTPTFWIDEYNMIGSLVWGIFPMHAYNKPDLLKYFNIRVTNLIKEYEKGQIDTSTHNLLSTG